MIINILTPVFLVLSLISISRNIPVWAPAFSLLFIILKIIMIYFNILPNRRVTGFLISGFFTFILVVHGTQDRLQFSSLFLCLLASLKYADVSEAQRDSQYFALSATLLTGSLLMNSRDSANILLSVFSIPVYWSFAASGSVPVRRIVSIGLISLIPAFMLMGLSIRMSSRLNLMSAGKARTGLGDTVMPGNIGELVMNREPVLKLEAAGRWNDVYLRSAVFDRTDGFNWFGSVHDVQPAVFPLRTENSGPKIKIQLRPVTDSWVPIMENVYNLSSSRSFSGNREIGFRHNENKILYYIFEYDRKGAFPGDMNSDIREYLTVPKYDKDIENWLEKNGLTKSLKTAEKLKLLILLFKKNGFQYSLNPKRLRSKNRLREFLFESRVGFCEHYASGTAILLRYLSVPSRLITGYLGAEYNRLGNYWSVTQASAHAWLEYWEDGYWHRFDPTSEIEPERLSSPPSLFMDFLISGERSLIGNSDILKEIKSDLNSVSEALDWQILSGIQLSTAVPEFTQISGIFPESEIILYSVYGVIFILLTYTIYIKYINSSGKGYEPEMQEFISELKRKNLFNDPLMSPSEKLKKTEELLKTDMHLNQYYERLRFAEDSASDRKVFLRNLKTLISLLKRKKLE